MVGLFGYLALRRMRQLDDSRRALEAMANHLNDAREQALRASQAKSEFLTNMSHAIRTPFHGMLGMLSLLRESRLDARQQELLRTAVDSADALLGLLNDIVDLSKLEAGTLTLDVHDVELEPLLREVERVTRAGAAAKALQLTVDIDPALPRRVRLDGARLRQVLTNLTANAVRFTHRGSVALACRVTPALAGAEPGLLFTVSDTGVGMSADTVLRLFERSHLPERGPARDPMRQGTGLGLEVAHRLVRLMEGDITVDSTLGQGSVFRVALPLRALPESADLQPQLAASAPAASARARHVLVAEDNAVNRLFLAALLDRMGHSAHFVENGLEALQAVQEHRFDIVLMDVHMPVMDGIAATEAIRQLDAQAATLPIVALTADAYADTRTRCLSAGMDDVLVKPLGLPELDALFQRCFGSAAPRPDDTRAGQTIGAGMALLDPQVLARLIELMPRAEAARLYDSLLTQAGDATERMRRALRDADTDELRRVSHGLKGAALNLGLHALAEAAGRLSASAASTSASQLALALQRFDETLVATRALCATEPRWRRLDPSSRALHHHRLGLEPDAEAAVDALLDRARQHQHLGAAGAAAIDQHQRLLVVHRRATDRLALPAAGVDQPAGGQLEAAIGQRVVHDVRVARDDVPALFGADHRVLEEAADVADLARIGQLAATDRAHPIEHLLRSRLRGCRFRAPCVRGRGSRAPASSAWAGASAGE